MGWIRSSLSFNRSVSIESFKRSLTDNEADHDHKDEPSQDDAPKEDCPDLAPYCLSEDCKDCCFLFVDGFLKMPLKDLHLLSLAYLSFIMQPSE